MPPPFHCDYRGPAGDCNNPSGTCYRTETSARDTFNAADVTNLLKVYIGAQDDEADLTFFEKCGDYDDSGALGANDVTNMMKYYNGQLPVASHLAMDHSSRQLYAAVRDNKLSKRLSTLSERLSSVVGL